MQTLRAGLMRSTFFVLLGLAVAGCSSGAGSVPPAPAAASAVTAATSGSAAPTLAPAAPTIAAGGGTGDCAASMTGGHVKFTLDGFEAWHFCGPATASVTLGTTAVQITSGWCETNAAGYSVAIGTQLFGSPSPTQEPDMLNILVNPTTGIGPVSGVLDHKHWLIVGQAPVTFGAGKLSGTFSGTDHSGAAVHGSFTC